MLVKSSLFCKDVSRIDYLLEKQNKKKTHAGPSHTMYNINSKWITDIHMKPRTVQLPEKIIGEILGDFGVGKIFLDYEA